MGACSGCGLTYARFRTGLTYRQVYHLIFDRKHKRRRGVLGYWHQLKREMWAEHNEDCEPVPF